ncbi:MAG: dihydroneopterin aldolase [Acidobacteria bacterium]|nr:dihydroneopterin aldolase [Acidobacteriota bacterium]MCI0655751.1 dihydroneopterin aldolase [Acidobacteriota bacterium]
MREKILLSGIRFHGYHGLTRMEREVGGRYSIDLELTFDYSKAIASDRIADTLDYRKVHRIVQEIGRGKSFRLIEALAGKIVATVFEQVSVEEIFIRVRKETPVLDGIVESVGVELRRSRSDF